MNEEKCCPPSEDEARSLSGGSPCKGPRGLVRRAGGQGLRGPLGRPLRPPAAHQRTAGPSSLPDLGEGGEGLSSGGTGFPCPLHLLRAHPGARGPGGEASPPGSGGSVDSVTRGVSRSQENGCQTTAFLGSLWQQACTPVSRETSLQRRGCHSNTQALGCPRRPSPEGPWTAQDGSRCCTGVGPRAEGGPQCPGETP